MGDFEAIKDIAQWLQEKSSGTSPFPSYENRGLAPSLVELVRDYQDEGLAADVALVRRGGKASSRLRRLEELVAASSDAPRYYIYRGLRLDGVVVDMLATFEEPTVNSWSLFPGVALAIARAHGSGECVIVRDRLAPGSAAFYVDDYEHEVLRPALSVETLLRRQIVGEPFGRQCYGVGVRCRKAAPVIMAVRTLEDVFGPFLRGRGERPPMTSDGRLLDPEGPAKQAARRLFRADPVKHADEIIAIMKPYCVRFDVEAVRRSLISKAARVGTNS